ncbi:hypothetical protein EIN_425020 [Entamoeba invadens IP1]|uniref:Uncharacterized protein n=1 Tax=Entamoeba invadens IP1 TaxID=370355 RepID=A0A0A1U628_ENTIV|nr:hypothetical protein EIN_425020 [Entamoeba invadens IP1]ELP89780.1 hypothetical protein EIN_425020 [Entamoeba invadens IP1]|eukprot:XP_004256551.1 hypothetical protein EIN_425020 [Entamoeba invadens IP1]
MQSTYFRPVAFTHFKLVQTQFPPVDCVPLSIQGSYQYSDNYVMQSPRLRFDQSNTHFEPERLYLTADNIRASEIFQLSEQDKINHVADWIHASPSTAEYPHPSTL